MAFANNLAEYFNVDLKEILKNYKLWSEGYKLWIDEDGFVHREFIIDKTENTEAAAESTEDTQENTAAETTEITESIKENATTEAEAKKELEKAAKENAKDCLYYGFGRKYWNSLGLDKETANRIWQQATKDLENN